jgi:hypothetical protein
MIQNKTLKISLKQPYFIPRIELNPFRIVSVCIITKFIKIFNFKELTELLILLILNTKKIATETTLEERTIAEITGLPKFLTCKAGQLIRLEELSKIRSPVRYMN